MLYDRPYMREPEYRPNALKPLYWLLGGIVGVFIIQMLLLRFFGPQVYHSFHKFFALSPDGIESGYLWTFLTYGFLHANTGSFWLIHILINCFMIFWTGRVLLPLLGAQRFFALYGLAVFMGGVLYFMVNFWKPGLGGVIGASGGVMGLLIAFALHFPNQPIQVLLFFVIPVSITPINLVKILVIIDVVGLLFNELAPFGGLPIAHSAHLGGALAGWVFVKFMLNKDFTFNKPEIRPPSWMKSKKTSNATTGRFRINFTNRKELQKEVDRILDKITMSGFGSLTEEERNTLDKAKELLNK